MKIKSTARISGLRPEMVLGLFIMDGVFKSHGSELIITSALDSKHGYGSLHFRGDGVDLRTRHLQEHAVGPIIDEMKDKLGPDFDVVLEGNHIHVEFQPKTGINI